MGLTRVEKIMVLDWGQSEMALNSCLEELEGRMTLKRMWKLILQARQKRGTMRGGEQCSWISCSGQHSTEGGRNLDFFFHRNGEKLANSSQI